MENTTINLKKSNSKIPIVQGAMDSEIHILIKNLEQVQERNILGFPFYEGMYKNRPVIIQKTFQGMTNAAGATMLAITHFSPACIINQGVCGGHNPALHRGDIILGQDIINYANFKIGFTDSKNPFEGCQPIGLEIPDVKIPTEKEGTLHSSNKVRIFHSNKELLRIAQSIPSPEKKAKVFTGTIASADAWIDRKDLMKCLQETYNTSGEDMESASVAQLCYTYQIPFLSVRALSNSLVNDEEFDESTTDKLQEFTLQILSALL